ncbi:MAG: hypothetical protein AAGG79_01185 [Pseudomonadota bacterium]
MNPQDITEALRANLAMTRGDPSWADQLDMSASKVFRSFWAVPLAVPAMVLNLSAQRQLSLQTPASPQAQMIAAMPSSVYFVSFVAVSLMVWAVEIGIFVGVAQRRGMGWKVSPMIITANWSKFAFLVAAGLGTGLAIALGTPGLSVISLLVAYGLLFYLRWGILRRTLDLSPAGSMGMLGVLVLSVFLATFIAAMFLVPLLEVFGVEIRQTLISSSS